VRLKPAILSILGRDDLKHIVDDLEIDGVDRRSVEGMRVALGRARRVKPEGLLGYMRKDQIEEVCELVGVSAKGKRYELAERLLEGEQAAMKIEQPKSKAADSQKAKVVATKKSNDPPVRCYEALWLDGPVPSGYWDHLKNRRLYVRWLGQKLGFRKQEDWYRISTDDFKRNSGGGVLEQHWNRSAIGAVKECFPDYDWKEWLFRISPRHFWKDPRNHRRYMKWLGQALGIRRPSDWYGVTNQDFNDNKGGAFLLYYDSTVSIEVYPIRWTV
jgi:hypothetical protein